MKKRILVLGAGFGGLELSTVLSEAFGHGVEVTLIDKGDAFTFGFSKLDVMFGRTTPGAVRLPYEKFVKPGVRFLQETIASIDPIAKRVTTDRGTHEADFLVVALGADYDFDATPGLVDTTEFYTVAGAARLGEMLPTFTKGHVLIGVCGAPYKCPPAPSEAAADDARLPHDPWHPESLRDYAHPSTRSPGASVTRDLAGIARCVRGAEHHFRRRPRSEVD
jgi:sulfide:quinone oxidoreductase